MDVGGVGGLLGVATWTPVDIEHAVRASWGAETRAPEDLPDWHPGNSARGQCGVTALVLHDLLGGDLVRGEVHRAGRWVDFHGWNRFSEVLEIDLAREQFAPDETVGPGTVIRRSPSTHRLREECEILRGGVLAVLDGGTR